MAMARKEVLHLRRDSRSLLLAFLLPALLVVLFGYAITWDVEDIRTSVLDLDGSSRSRELLDAFEASGYFTVVRRLTRQAQVEEVLDRGEALVVVVVPPDFARDIDEMNDTLDLGVALTPRCDAQQSKARAATFASKLEAAFPTQAIGDRALKFLKIDWPNGAGRQEVFECKRQIAGLEAKPTTSGAIAKHNPAVLGAE